MIPFEATLKVDDETLDFSFNRVHTTDREKLFVNVKRGAVYFAFDMIKGDGGKWRIVEPAPAWAKELESALSTVISQNL
jgi:hypothetical protein